MAFEDEWMMALCSMCPAHVMARSSDDRPLCDECAQYVIEWNDEADEIEATIPSDARIEREGEGAA